MPPQPKRKWHGRRPGGNAPKTGDTASPAASIHSNASATGSTTQMPKRPKIEQENVVPQDASKIKAMYSTAASGGEAKRFSEMAGKLDKSLLQGLEKMGFEYMSPVQQKVLTELPEITSDCIVKAKTGTGKTVAFLLPAIQNLLAGNAPPRGKVGILIVCPTRELALQIAQEANGVVACLPRKMEVHTAFGGTARASSLKRFLDGNPTILVATPGRLDDILSNEENARECFTHVKTVVLDEADRMLDQGFAPAVKKILKMIPPKSDGWQGMCFSATMNDDVLSVAKILLHPGYTTLSTVDPNEVPTHERVPQYYITVPNITNVFPALLALLAEEQQHAPEDFKAIIFGTTANGVALLYDLLRPALPKSDIYELHSRMSQTVRTKTTTKFKDCTSGILVASDVVGRGMDFPNVGLVVQVGLPSASDQYIHRVGRTARAGKDGRAVLLLTTNESFFVHTNKSLPLVPYPVDITPQLASHESNIQKALTKVDEEAKRKAYQAFLGYNKTFLKKLRLTPDQLVQLANEYALKAMRCPEVPMIGKRTVGKMGLKGVKGLRIGTIEME